MSVWFQLVMMGFNAFGATWAFHDYQIHQGFRKYVDFWGMIVNLGVVLVWAIMLANNNGKEK